MTHVQQRIMEAMNGRPEPSEVAEYFFTYIKQVPDGDIRQQMQTQATEMAAWLNSITEDDSLRRYAPGKWSIREVLGHIIDCERLFVYRAMWFARGHEDPLPSFEQDLAAVHAGSHDVTWRDLVDEFLALRRSTVAFFRALPPAAWSRQGIASGNPFSVRALAWVTVGHVAHHMRILRERYLTA